jgi:hypothetical protein
MNRYVTTLIPRVFGHSSHNPGVELFSTITVDRVDRTARVEDVDGLDIDFELFVQNLLIELTANSDCVFNRDMLRLAAYSLYRALGGQDERV